MSLPSLVNRACVIVSRTASGTANAYGDKINAETSTAAVWELQQRGRSEGEDEVSDTRWVAYFQPGVELRSGDAILDGDTGEFFEVDGDPWPARNPRTRVVSHIEASVRRTSGPGDGS